MELGKLGVWCFTDTLTPAQLTELAQHTERLGVTVHVVKKYLPIWTSIA